MRTFPVITRWVFLALLAPLAGCGFLFGDDGFFPDRSQDYKNAPELEVIEVPADKSTEALQDNYPIPDIEQSLVLAGDFEVPRPAPLVAGAADEVVRIQRLGDESWALVAMAPGQLWPQVRSFLSAAGIQVTRVDARAGIMESNWLTMEGATMQSRFQFRIERGVQRGTSELHVLQMNQAGDVNTWPGKSDDLQQEGEMLRGVAQYNRKQCGHCPSVDDCGPGYQRHRAYFLARIRTRLHLYPAGPAL